MGLRPDLLKCYMKQNFVFAKIFKYKARYENVLLITSHNLSIFCSVLWVFFLFSLVILFNFISFSDHSWSQIKVLGLSTILDTSLTVTQNKVKNYASDFLVASSVFNIKISS